MVQFEPYTLKHNAEFRWIREKWIKRIGTQEMKT